MFRELERKKKQITNEECIEILNNEKRGVLSVIGDEGYPYGMPMNHFYNEADGNIYFHSGKTGHRNDAIEKCSKASFCVYDKGYVNEGEWALNIKSVIVFGKIEVVENLNEVIDITRKLSYKFTSDNEYIENEIKHYADKTRLLKLKVEHMCGKMIAES